MILSFVVDVGVIRSVVSIGSQAFAGDPISSVFIPT
jgi:hypothetical protein